MNSFDRIAGYEREKKELMDLVDIFNNRRKYQAKGATLPKGIIFYGEAGTGKTLFAEVMSKECSLNRINVSLSKGASENNICREIKKAFLKGAKSRMPTMIFFDELDKILPNDQEEYYTDQAKAVLAQLLTLIDGMEVVNNIVFVATCNNYSSLPQSITRPGRFDKKIGLSLPDSDSRSAILRMYMNAAPASYAMQPESIARLTGGFSCAALKTLVNECLLRSDEDNFVSEELIRSKIAEIKEENIPTERSDQSYVIDAVRNVGSFIVSRYHNNSSYVLNVEKDTVCNVFYDSLIQNTNVDDYYDDDEDDDEEKSEEYFDGVFSKKDYLAAICALLGGFAAEELEFNKIYDNLDSNVSLADRVLTRMSSLGMLGLELIYIDRPYPDIPYPETHFEKLHNAFTSTMHDCYNEARSILEKNKDLIGVLSAELIKRKSIEKGECESIIEENGGLRI